MIAITIAINEAVAVSGTPQLTLETGSSDAVVNYSSRSVGNPSFSAADIATSADGAEDVYIADMDNDGDMDIVSASANDDAIAWYENGGLALASV